MIENIVNVLLVEDQPETAEYIQSLLGLITSNTYPPLDYEISHIHSLLQCSEQILSQPVDVILMESNLLAKPGNLALFHKFISESFPPLILLRNQGEDISALLHKEGLVQEVLVKEYLNPFSLESAIRNAIQRKKAEVALKVSEIRFSSLIQQSGDAFVLADEGGRVVLWNPAAERIFGLPETETLGAMVWEVLFTLTPEDQSTPEFQAEVREAIRDYLSKGSADWLNVQQELEIRRPDGAQITVQALLYSIPTPGGYNLCITCRDISKRKQAEDALLENLASQAQHAARLAALLQLGTDMASLHDQEGILDLLVKRAAQLADSPVCTVMLFDWQKQEAWVAAHTPFPVELPADYRVSLQLPLLQNTLGLGKPLIVSDIDQEAPELRRLLLHPGIQASYAYPMQFEGRVTGCLTLSQLQPGAPSEQDNQIYQLLANRAAAALESARLFDETKKYASQMGLLYDAGLALNNLLEPQAQLEYLFKIAIDTLEADRASFFRYYPAQEYLKFDLGIGFSQEALEEMYKITRPASEDQSLTGWVAINRIPLNIPDLDSDPRYLPIDPQLKSGLFVPVEHENQLLGVLVAFSMQPHAFDRDDERLLLLFANQAAVALENAELHQIDRNNIERFQAFHNIDMIITGSLDQKFVLDSVLDLVIRQLSVDAADILIYDPHQQTLNFNTSHGFNSSALEYTHLRIGESYAGQAALDRKIIHIPNLANAENGLRRSNDLRTENFVTYYGVPLIVKGEIKGVLELFHRRPFKHSDDWMENLETLALQTAIAIENSSLFASLQKSNLDLVMAYEKTIEGWSRALDMHEGQAQGHNQRLAQMAVDLARHMNLPDNEITGLRRGALLHDIGMLSIPANILQKRGELDEAEWEIVRRHPMEAYNLLAPIDYLHAAVDIPYCHHEKWDGSGYPRGLQGEQIPLAARIFAVVDVWDALLSDRPYRKAWNHEAALVYLHEASGTHFDPQAVSAFVNLVDKMGQTH